MFKQQNQFRAAYSDDSFWEKVKDYTKSTGAGFLELALKMYYAGTDSDTPVWARSAILGALGYFISPIDAIPDLTPIVGYTDDLGVLTAAFAVVAANIKEVHVTKAKETVAQWFS